MKTLASLLCCAVFLAILAGSAAAPASAQTVEAVGSRALGMAGAVVAVANDSSATWWNPAGPAAGPFVDVAIARSITGSEDSRAPAWSVALTTPPFGISYYRLRITDIRRSDPTGEAGPDREDRRAGLGVRSTSASQFGATILQTLVTGVHVGTTVKYVRGDGEGGFDLDVGALAVAGAIRVGALVRNVREPELGSIRLPRQVRVGAAFDAEAIDARPLVLSIDADLRAYQTALGDRRVIAAGAEHWFRARRIGIRGGARVNTAGAGDGAVTAGVSVAPRAALYIDSHIAVGGGAEDGWGIAARVSF